jgi:preprotein translocase subunit SecE
MNIFQKFINYLRSSREEFKKVSWPSRRDTFRYSALVIGVSVIVGAFFAGLDSGFTKLVDVMITARRQAQVQLPTVQTQSQPTVTPTTAPVAPSTPVIDLGNTKPIVTPNAGTAPTK